MINKLAVAIVAALFAVSLSGCGGSPESEVTTKTPPTSPVAEQPPPNTVEIGGKQYTPHPETLVSIDGQSYACEELIFDDIESGPCDEVFQVAFDLWGENIDSYVNSGVLGPLGNGGSDGYDYETVATVGLVACVKALRGQTEVDYIDYMQETEPDVSGTMFLPLWFGASRLLCPDVKFTSSTGQQSSDFVVE